MNLSKNTGAKRQVPELLSVAACIAETGNTDAYRLSSQNKDENTLISELTEIVTNSIHQSQHSSRPQFFPKWDSIWVPLTAFKRNIYASMQGHKDTSQSSGPL